MSKIDWKVYNVWHTDKPVETIKSEEYLPLERLQKLVGGYIEIHRAGKTLFIVDEEGTLKAKKANPAFPAFVGIVITTQNGLEHYMRISQKDLQQQVDILNADEGFDPAAVAYNTVGAYILDGAYGGWRLCKITNTSGGQTDISSIRQTAKELYYTLTTIQKFKSSKWISGKQVQNGI